MELDSLIQVIKNSYKTAWIMCGLPYSGKTYLSKEIRSQLDIVYVSIDAILKDKGYNWDEQKIPDEQGWQEVFELSYQQLQEALKQNKNVLYDSTNHTKVSRDILRDKAKDVGAETNIIYLDVPLDIMWHRWEESAAQKHRAVIAKDLVEKTIADFEKPGEAENVFKITE